MTLKIEKKISAQQAISLARRLDCARLNDDAAENLLKPLQRFYGLKNSRGVSPSRHLAEDYAPLARLEEYGPISTLAVRDYEKFSLASILPESYAARLKDEILSVGDFVKVCLARTVLKRCARMSSEAFEYGVKDIVRVRSVATELLQEVVTNNLIEGGQLCLDADLIKNISHRLTRLPVPIADLIAKKTEIPWPPPQGALNIDQVLVSTFRGNRQGLNMRGGDKNGRERRSFDSR